MENGESILLNLMQYYCCGVVVHSHQSQSLFLFLSFISVSLSVSVSPPLSLALEFNLHVNVLNMNDIAWTDQENNLILAQSGIYSTYCSPGNICKWEAPSPKQLHWEFILQQMSLSLSCVYTFKHNDILIILKQR